MGGCGEGILSLRCLFSENWIFEFLQKAKGIAQKCNLKEIRIDPKLHCSCSKSKVESSTYDGKLCKAAARDNSEDNFLHRPAAADAQHANSRHFRLSLSKGEPVIVTDVHKNALGLSWEPMVMSRACRQTKKSMEALNCLNWCMVEKNIHQFFKGYMEGRFESYGWPQLLQLPPFGLFDEWLPRRGAEFSCCLPFKEYTHPQYGYLNLAPRLPDNCVKPDLGPQAYIAYGFPKELGRGDSVTKLHYAVTDTVHVLMHTQAVVPERMIISREKHKRDGLKVEDAKNISPEKVVVPFYGQISLQDLKKHMAVLYGMSLGGKMFLNWRNISGSTSRNLGTYICSSPLMQEKINDNFLEGIEPWTFLQKLGEAVFVPAGCPYQVRNLESCMNVAVDFISPENVNKCIRLTEELRKLPRNHVAREVKLGKKDEQEQESYCNKIN